LFKALTLNGAGYREGKSIYTGPGARVTSQPPAGGRESEGESDFALLPVLLATHSRVSERERECL